ncbi:MAG: pyrroloquinoline quinone-dependent dehydrogenase [Bryobacteraceae bacterium]|nr:pyrroloquinoline quinone-dependent dehydrogenase [Bryobacteraceae bacterium]
MTMTLVIAAVLAQGQSWEHYGGDAGGRKYSPLKQIHRGNVTRLQVAWTFRTGDISDGQHEWPFRSAFEATPLYVAGTLYFSTPFNRVIALEPETGRQLWAFDPHLDRKRGYNLLTHRGVAHWTDGTRRRIVYGTQDGRLFSLDAKTGQPDPQFGQGGSLDLRTGMADGFDGRAYGMTSPPAIYQNLVICGSWVSDGEPRGPSGDIRAFDVRTGQLVWRFATADPSSFAGDGAKQRGGLNMWSIASVDTERGLVFLPLTSPSPDLYGGDRHGANLYGDSLVALDAKTGQRRWHFQTVHHNIWDYDLPAQPLLVTVTRQGKPVAAVAQVTKTGFLFLLDRETGQPLFEVRETPVAKSLIPGEAAWPTQPIPVRPPPFARQSMRPEELRPTPACQEIARDATFGALYTPIGPTRTVLFPGTNGGANWGGASYDPATQTLFVNSMDAGMTFQLLPRPTDPLTPFRAQAAKTNSGRFWDDELHPCQQPPWGHLTAIDLSSGTFRWRSVLGITRLGATGAPNLGGSLVTAGGLLLIGATNDDRFRAFDLRNGREIWTVTLPASAFASPMTFWSPKTRKQYVVIAAGGGNKYSTKFADALVAYALK